jgi:hypothetical protein
MGGEEFENLGIRKFENGGMKNGKIGAVCFNHKVHKEKKHTTNTTKHLLSVRCDSLVFDACLAYGKVVKYS